MGVTDMLARLAVRRAHVLIAESPGHWATRAALQRRLSDRGWREASSPADADVLAVCGPPGPQLADLVDALWDQMPGPRTRVEVADAATVDDALDRVTASLLDSGAQRRDARIRAQRPEVADESDGHGDADHAGMDHGHMNHGDMDMAPEGIPLAQGDEDRDGLEMDVLHVRLGPVLVHWPAGLVLCCTLSGDAVTDAQARVVDGVARDPDANSAGPRAAARQCDHLDDLLALAGWPREAAVARRCRDLLLIDDDHEPAARLLSKLHRNVARSRLLRWSLRGIAPLTAEHVRSRGLPAALAGDTHSRLLERLRITTDLMSNPLSANPLHIDSGRLLDALPDMVRGLDLATARLAVAGLGIETAVPAEVGPP